eukprot:1158826-Pelagomonas_calceolata.AAC.4
MPPQPGLLRHLPHFPTPARSLLPCNHRPCNPAAMLLLQERVRKVGGQAWPASSATSQMSRAAEKYKRPRTPGPAGCTKMRFPY